VGLGEESTITSYWKCVQILFSFKATFHQILTGKIWLPLIQRILHGKNDPNSSNIEEKKSKLPNSRKW
jgi:hypothetical protein